MNFENYKWYMLSLLLFALLLSSCDVLMADGGEDQLSASGVVEAYEVLVSSEMGGKVADVFKQEGQQVEAGEILFRIEDNLLDAERNQAVAALESAQAQLAYAETAHEAARSALSTAEIGVEIANLQYDLELDNARLAYQPDRMASWNQVVPDEFSQPTWYFQSSEKIAAAEAEVEAAKKSLETEVGNFNSVLDDATQGDLRAAEERLLKAQAAFLVAEKLSGREIDRDGMEDLADLIDIDHDEAASELEAAQSAYEAMLTGQSAADVLEARARLSVAREKYHTSLDYLNALLTGENSKALKVAEANIKGAESSVSQVEANIKLAQSGVLQSQKAVNQAQAALDLIDLQIDKLNVPSSVSGVVMTRNIEPGEVIQPGMTAFTIGQLDQLTIKVFVPEDLYGQISLGDEAVVSVDSFPSQTFSANVIHIADQAEYTPRNVQTQEDRQTTVFEIKLALNNPNGMLKPGMPADVVFQ